MHIETMGRPPGCKLIRISADIEEGRIRSLSIRGDFFASPEDSFENVERRMTGIALSETERTFNALIKEEGITVSGITGEGIAQLLQEAEQW